MIVLAFATASNLLSRRVLRVMIALIICAEVIGSVGLGITLLFFYDVNPMSVVFDNGVGGSGSWTMSAVLLGVGFAGWSFLGFESSGAIGEEIQDAPRNVPKALRYSLLAIAAIVMFSTLSLILAVPDLGAVLSGDEVDPVGAALAAHLGETVTRLAFAVFAVGFTACVLGLQTGLSRVIWAFARDRALPASRWLSKLTDGERIPARAVAVTAVLPLPIFLLTGSQVYAVLVGYTIGGWYLTFALVLLAALIARSRGTWENGPFTLGAWSLPIGIAALVWAVFETVNVAWPRALVSGPDWYLQWAVVLVVALLAVVGWVVYAGVRSRIVPYEES